MPWSMWMRCSLPRITAIDVQDLGADVVVSSSYKWFGPHMGVLWGREELLKETFSYKVRPAGDDLPHKFETGTLSHEGMAGCLGRHRISRTVWARRNAG